MFKDHFKKISITATTMIIFSLAASTALSIFYFVTKSPIEESDAKAKRIFLNQVIQANLYDNNLVKIQSLLSPIPSSETKKILMFIEQKKIIK
jgi:Na+-translocating ferredoxin:NAD+ oxidoreductase RnfG subunit